MELFRNSRLRMTLTYSSFMGLFLVVLIVVVRFAMEWALFSEQERELSDATGGIAEAQAYKMRYSNTLDSEDNVNYISTNDRIFYYIFENRWGQLVGFVRAPFKVEPFILEYMNTEKIPRGTTKIFAYPNENGQKSRIMMISKKIRIYDLECTAYVGKDVTALYSGLQKATYLLVLLGLLALALASVLGHVMAGRAIIPMKEAYEKQKQFAADASHELRTPLAVVMASADLLLADKSIENPLLREVIEDLKGEVKKMSKLVSDLLMVARSDNNALKVKIQKLNLGELLEQNIRMMKPLAEKKGITLEGVELRKVTIQGDEQKIKQLILILVDNAIKYTTDGGRVLVTLESADDEKVVFSVQDSGIGIAPEDIDRIFERFYRVDKARSREMGGNGLGLSIATEILRLHGGKISVESELGVGTKFIVTLKTNLSSE